MSGRTYLEGNPFRFKNKRVTRTVTNNVMFSDGVTRPASSQETKTVGSIRNWLPYLFEKYKNAPVFSSREGRDKLINVLKNAELVIKDIKRRDKLINNLTRAGATFGSIVVGGGATIGGGILGGVPAALGVIMMVSMTAGSVGLKVSVSTPIKERVIATVMEQLKIMNGFNTPAPTRYFQEQVEPIILRPNIPSSTEPFTTRELLRFRYEFAQVLTENGYTTLADEMERETDELVPNVDGQTNPLFPSDGIITNNPLLVLEANRRQVPAFDSDSEDDSDEEQPLIRRADFGGRGLAPDSEIATRNPAAGMTSPRANGGAGRQETPESRRTEIELAPISPLATAGVGRSAGGRAMERQAFPPQPPPRAVQTVSFDPLNNAQPETQTRKKGGLVRGKKNKAVPIIAHEGELVVPKKDVPAVLQSSAWKRHIQEIAKAKNMTFAQAKQYALGNRSIKKKTKPKRKSYMSESSESDW
jgi:hypothetical protein